MGLYFRDIWLKWKKYLGICKTNLFSQNFGDMNCLDIFTIFYLGFPPKTYEVVLVHSLSQLILPKIWVWFNSSFFLKVQLPSPFSFHYLHFWSPPKVQPFIYGHHLFQKFSSHTSYYCKTRVNLNFSKKKKGKHGELAATIQVKNLEFF